ncbi:ATP-binding protein, partial [Pseudobutyrivibrio sp.]
MLKRKAYAEIENWVKNDFNHALLVTGARQIGKTYLIRKVLEDTDSAFVEINFIKQPELISIFSGIDDISMFYDRLTAVVQIPAAKDVFIFFDEIQECKDIVTWVKFLVEDGKYRFVFSGSLLGVELSDLRSAPVGFIHTTDMYPMDLFEFFTAMGVKDSTLEMLNEHFENRIPMDEFIHGQLMKVFNLYLIVGGMPEVVQRYIDTNDLSQVAEIQKDIILQYKQDFTKYEKKSKLQLREIYDAIPSELEEKNKRFFMTHIDGKVSFDRVKNNFIWLKNAGVALPVYNVTEPKIPLKISEKRNLFKLFLSDVGLLTSMYSNEVRLKILTNERDINNGGIYENLVAQELATRNIPLYYYNSKKLGELDFVIELRGKSIPIEVKSGKNYEKHSALDNCIKEENFGIDEAYVLCNDNIRVDGN